MKRFILALGWLMFLSVSGWAGTQTPKGFLYKPDLGARGAAEKSLYDAGLDRVDARLGKQIWLGDPGGTPGYDTLAHAITTIGGSNAILRLPAGTIAIAADTTIPANITVKPERGAIFAVADGKTLTLNSPPDAGPYQIFSWTGTGKVAGLSTVNAAWFGAVGDGATDNAAAFTAAAAALGVNSTFKIPPAAGVYQFSTGFAITKGYTRLEIDGKLEFTGSSGAAITIGPGAAGDYIEYVNGHIKSLARNTQNWSDTVTGLRFDGTRSCTIDVREISNFTYNIELYSSNLNNNYHNLISCGYSNNAKIHVHFNGGEGRMNANTFIGPHCKDNGSAADYTGTYGIYMPRGTTNQTNGCTFYSPMFDWSPGGKITNNIYIGGSWNSIISPRLVDGSPSDVAIRLHESANSNQLLLAYGDDSVCDPGRQNSLNCLNTLSINKIRFHKTATYNENYNTYRPGDRWMNNAYDEQKDSPGKICITAGSYYPATASTATTTAGSGTVNLSSVSGIYVGAFIDIAGVTGPLEITARDSINKTITVSPVADASVNGAAITFRAPTFVDEDPASLRGYKSNWNPPSIAVGGSATTTLTVTGAAVGDMVVVGIGVNTQGMIPFGYVSATDIVTIGLANNTAGAVNLDTIELCVVRVFKY
jgi:hypothetical protein